LRRPRQTGQAHARISGARDEEDFEKTLKAFFLV